ncbi:MAG: hypothetical protein IJP32_11440, partial [Clostridia bacterium]|nr:hypothetical protein [Clostridia bacterium]
SGIPGHSGFSGSSGIPGHSGFSGSSGISGHSGFSGSSGISGHSGFSGSSGILGHSGFSGSSGHSGLKKSSQSYPSQIPDPEPIPKEGIVADTGTVNIIIAVMTYRKRVDSFLRIIFSLVCAGGFCCRILCHAEGINSTDNILKV